MERESRESKGREERAAGAHEWHWCGDGDECSDVWNEVEPEGEESEAEGEVDLEEAQDDHCAHADEEREQHLALDEAADLSVHLHGEPIPLVGEGGGAVGVSVGGGVSAQEQVESEEEDEEKVLDWARTRTVRRGEAQRRRGGARRERARSHL